MRARGLTATRGHAVATTPACLRSHDGNRLDGGAHRWTGALEPADERLLARVAGPALDVGCGPGRHVLALAQKGVVALGIDISSPAVALALGRGAPVLQRSVFDQIPGAGRWHCALLLDGNIGIGARPVQLLRRVASLLHSEGEVFVELATGGGDASCDVVQLEIDGHGGPWFRWTCVGVDELERLAHRSRLTVRESWCDADRWFARLAR